MFLASKFKALEHITSDKLVMFTDYSITIQELKVRKSYTNVPVLAAGPSQSPVFKMKIPVFFILTAEFYTAEQNIIRTKMNTFFIIII